MFDDDVLISGVVDSDSIPVETIDGQVLFRVPKSACVLFNESYWKFIEFLQGKNENILSADWVDCKFMVLINEHRKYLNSVIHAIDLVQFLKNKSMCETLIGNDPKYASINIEWQHMKTFDHVNKKLWNNHDFVVGLISIINNSFDNYGIRGCGKIAISLRKAIAENCPKKIFRSRSVLNVLSGIFHLLDIEKVDVPKKIFREWIANGRVKFHIICGKQLDFKNKNVNKYINVENLVLYSKRWIFADHIIARMKRIMPERILNRVQHLF